MNCSLCESQNIKFVYFQKHFERNFYKCNECELHFSGRDSLLNSIEEKSRYDNHENSKRTPGYEAFLSTLLDPLLNLVTKNEQGLDFGSGPYPMLQKLALESGHKMQIYDPFYAKNDNLLNETYDYVTCCEVVEHFHSPKESFKLLVSLLNEGAYLGIMTGILYSHIDLSNWHYIKDDTHVSLYTPNTIKWISINWNLKIVYFEKNVVIFQLLRKMNGCVN